MSVGKTGIAAECVCDLPSEYLEKYDIDILRFLIETERGVFADIDEITSENIVEYIKGGGKNAVSKSPEPDAYVKFFERCLKKHDEIVFVTISSQISESYKSAVKAAESMGEQGKKIHIFDSMNISAGIGSLVLKAAEMAEAGISADEIIKELEMLRDRIYSVFICLNADFLCRRGRVDRVIKRFSDLFSAHPVIYVKNGKLSSGKFLFGNYENAVVRFAGRELKKFSGQKLFTVHTGGSHRILVKLMKTAEDACRPDNISVSRSCAANSSVCGDMAFGLFYVRGD